jgi:hypothetical protein
LPNFDVEEEEQLQARSQRAKFSSMTSIALMVFGELVFFVTTFNNFINGDVTFGVGPLIYLIFVISLIFLQIHKKTCL